MVPRRTPNEHARLVKHAIDVGALRAGEQLPAIRRVAEDLVINRTPSRRRTASSSTRA
jgi:DNA-binding transcriptional regulator YhcF (GntR family)